MSIDFFLLLRATRFVTGSAHGVGSGPIYMAFCDQPDNDLDNCIAETDKCSHDRDVSVLCTGTFRTKLKNLNDTDLLLITL